LEGKDRDTLLAAKRRLETAGLEVRGPVDHDFCQSIYFFDPSGHRLELAARTERPGQLDQFRREAANVLRAWQARAARENWLSARTSQLVE
jgi:glyoxylase I family protein